jgi:hypothetical protein
MHPVPNGVALTVRVKSASQSKQMRSPVFSFRFTHVLTENFMEGFVSYEVPLEGYEI